MKLKLPYDLKKYTVFTVLKRVIPCIVLLALISVLLCFFGERIFPADNIAFRGMLYAFALALPFVITGVPLKLFDSSWQGKITAVDIKDRWGFTNEAIPRVYGKINVNLTVEKSNGDITFVEINERTYTKFLHYRVSENRKNEHFLDKYKVGDRIFHLYGTKHVVILKDGNEGPVICAVCRRENDIQNDTCCDCGHTIVKSGFIR